MEREGTPLVLHTTCAVGDLSAITLDSIISLTRNPPFTLDITGVDPDITYSVTPLPHKWYTHKEGSLSHSTTTQLHLKEEHVMSSNSQSKGFPNVGK